MKSSRLSSAKFQAQGQHGTGETLLQKMKEGRKMKFSIDKNIILENLSNVIKGVSTKNVIPVLNGIKFELIQI